MCFPSYAIPSLNPLPMPQNSYSPWELRINVAQGFRLEAYELWFGCVCSKIGLVQFVSFNDKKAHTIKQQ